MRGWRISEWSRYINIVPILFCDALSMGWAAVYLARLACGPDVIFDRKNNPDPWSNRNWKRHRFYSGTINWDEVKIHAPDYENETPTSEQNESNNPKKPWF